MSVGGRIAIAAAEGLVERALVAANTSVRNARCVARALVKSEIDGEVGHGLSRVQSYAAQARTGKVDGHAVPSADRRRASVIVVDAAHGFAFPALDLAVAECSEVSTVQGVAVAAIVRSHHAGALGLVVEALADRGLVGLMFANTPSAMAVAGGQRSLLGTNPIAFAAPRAGNPPLVIDLALSTVARGKILAAAQRDEPIPLGWALDATGKPTTDAKAALAGTLVPSGGAKGAALALMVETLASVLIGANLSSGASSLFDGEGAPPGVGQLLIAIDPTAFGTAGAYAARMEAMASLIEADGARLPGSQRAARRAAAVAEGVAVDAKALAGLRTLAR